VPNADLPEERLSGLMKKGDSRTPELGEAGEFRGNPTWSLYGDSAENAPPAEDNVLSGCRRADEWILGRSVRLS
jgi:hypothetical protein